MEGPKLDKFSEHGFGKLPEQIQWKLYRAKRHFEEFEREASAWMNAGPGEMVFAPESTPQKTLYVYQSKKPVPARFGLIAGDFVQNLRSALDYLVWQLILANGKIPHETNTGFPVCKSPSAFDKAKDRKLIGVPSEAITLIESLMPYPERQQGPAPQPIQVLDELTNENKHRQVLLPALGTIFKPNEPVPFPHIELEVIRYRGGESIPGERLLAYIAFQGGIVEGLEVTATLSAIMDWVGYDVLPQFEKFFVK